MRGVGKVSIGAQDNAKNTKMDKIKYPKGVPFSIIKRMGLMREKGFSYQEIADFFGVGASTAKRLLAKHGLTKKLVTRKRNKRTFKLVSGRNKKPNNECAPKDNGIKIINGSCYKIGINKFVFRGSGPEWKKSTMSKEEFYNHP